MKNLITGVDKTDAVLLWFMYAVVIVVVVLGVLIVGQILS